MDMQAKIHQLVTDHPVVLFMKGSPQFPRCGFSAKAVRILQDCGVVDFQSVDVLLDEGVRQGAKDYAGWPTFPQLYIKGRFVGGVDIMSEMFGKGELQTLLTGV